MIEVSRAFRAMNTEILAVIASEEQQEAEAALGQVEMLFYETEASLSRFRPDSELSRLNASGGQSFPASPLLFQAVKEASGAAATTNGIFDPTVLWALVTAGYDRSFEMLARDDREGDLHRHLESATVILSGAKDLLVGGRMRTGRSFAVAQDDKMRAQEVRVIAQEDRVNGQEDSHPSHFGGDTAEPPGRCVPARSPHSWRKIRLDASDRTITLPEGVGLDLGGIGKGWTVDRAAALLRPFDNFVVDAGGDIFVAGTQADGSLWTVGIENPFDPNRNLGVLELQDCAVATSTIRHRRWNHEGREQHHLIDPRTGQPARSGVISATVVASSVARAEVLAKVALLLGPHEGAEYLRQHPGVSGVLVLGDGSIEQVGQDLEVLHEI